MSVSTDAVVSDTKSATTDSDGVDVLLPQRRGLTQAVVTDRLYQVSVQCCVCRTNIAQHTGIAVQADRSRFSVLLSQQRRHRALTACCDSHAVSSICRGSRCVYWIVICKDRLTRGDRYLQYPDMATATPDVDLECPVCHEDFKQPKFLPCAHVVCSKCVLSWLSAKRQGGCPLCRAPILKASQRQSADLSVMVDSLPTDFATMSLIESQHALSGDHECSVCDGQNATDYCLQCGVKLCQSCAKVHKRYPAFQEHTLEDLKSLTAARLAASRRSPCDLHPDKMAELYCYQHQKMICLLCSSAHHRACPGVGTVGDVAVQARGEFQQQAQRLRSREADVTRKERQHMQEMHDALTHFKTCHAEVKATFNDLRQQLDKREKEIATQLQQHQDDVMSRMQAEKIALEQQRVSIAAHASTVERLIIPSPDSALLGMLEKLKARLDDLETQQQTPGGAGNMALKSAVFDKDATTRLLREIGALGQVTFKQKAPSVVTPVQPAKKQPQWRGGEGKPTGAKLARVLKVGNRVRRGQGWYSWRGDEDGRGPGTVTAVPSRIVSEGGWDPSGYVDVRWDNGQDAEYCMGRDGIYELELP